MQRINLAGSGLAFECGGDDTILRAGLRAGLALPYSCNTGSCGTCRFELEEGSVEHIRADPPAWSDRDRRRGRWLGCQARPLSDCSIRVRLDPTFEVTHPPSRRRGVLGEVTPLTHDISEFAFEIEGPDEFSPGQYALLGLDGVDAPRGYSMSNLPGDGVWRFQIKRVPGGEATGALFDRLAPGAEVAIDGPYGTAYLRESAERDLLLIAGGSGLSPMVSIARAAARSPALAGREIHFLYGCRTPADICGEDMLAALAGYGERLFYRAAISEPAPGDGWEGATGFIHDVAREAFGARLADMEVYFAGPPAMAAALQRMLHEAGAGPGHIHFDEFV
jgi:toluene monooxygenase electron transfer component